MNSPADDLHRQQSTLQRIDILCDEFEAAWQRGERPAVAEMLSRGSAQERRLLCLELVRLDIDYRRKRGEQPRIGDYSQLAGWDAELAQQVNDEALLENSAQQPPVRTSPEAFRFNLGDRLGPYQLLAKLGQGGMGAVYKVRHVRLGKTMALKIMAGDLMQSPEAVTRFEREMLAVGQVQHPNVVQAHDAGEIDGIHYLALEFVEGQDLQQLIRERGPLSVASACQVLRQAACGLAAAHEHGLVHRDLKPANLFATTKGQIKILDLGLANLAQAEEGLTVTGECFGSPDYMPPEQWENPRDCDARSDLYALGCTLFTLLTGAPPFSGERYSTAPRKMMGHVRDAAPDLTKACPAAPAELNALLQKLLAKSPAERVATAAELVQLLAPFVAGKSAEDPASVLAYQNSPLARKVDGTAKSGNSTVPPNPSATAVLRAPVAVAPRKPAPTAASDDTRDSASAASDHRTSSWHQRPAWLVGMGAVVVFASCAMLASRFRPARPSNDPAAQAALRPASDPVVVAPPAEPAQLPAVAGGVDRRFAELMVGQGYFVVVRVENGLRPVHKIDEMPKEPFVLITLGHGNSQPIPQSVVTEAILLARKLTNLEGGYLPQQQADLWAAAFADLPTLTSVNAYRSDLTDQGLQELLRLPQLKYLNLDGCAQLTMPGIREVGLAAELTVLELDGQKTGNGEYSLAQLQWLKNQLQPNVVIQIAGGHPIPGLVASPPNDAPRTPAVAPFAADRAAEYQQQWAAYLGVPKEYASPSGMKFVLIPPGEFTMGSSPREIEAAVLDTKYAAHWEPQILSERPAHRVRITRPYYLAVHEVTQAQFAAVMKENPALYSATGEFKSQVQGLDTSGFPVENVAWRTAVSFCERLQSLDGIPYRLPTEAEWEFACRAGTETFFWCGNSSESIRRSAGFVPGIQFGPAEEFPLNPFGLRGVHSNVREWVSDLWSPDYYATRGTSTVHNPTGPFQAKGPRVTKSGSHLNKPMEARSANHYGTPPHMKTQTVGFRVVASVLGVKYRLSQP